MILRRHLPCVVCLPNFIVSTKKDNSVHWIGMMTSSSLFPTPRTNMQKLNIQRKKKEIKLNYHLTIGYTNCVIFYRKLHQGVRPMLVLGHWLGLCNQGPALKNKQTRAHSQERLSQKIQKKVMRSQDLIHFKFPNGYGGPLCHRGKCWGI